MRRRNPKKLKNCQYRKGCNKPGTHNPGWRASLENGQQIETFHPKLLCEEHTKDLPANLFITEKGKATVNSIRKRFHMSPVDFSTVEIIFRKVDQYGRPKP